MSSFSATLYIMARKCYIRWDDNDVHFVLDQHAESDIYSASSLKQQFFVSRHVASLWNNSDFRANRSLLLLNSAACFIVNFVVKDTLLWILLSRTLLWILLSRIFYCEFCCQGHFIVNCVVKDILLWILLSRTFYCEFCCQEHFIVNFVVKDILLWILLSRTFHCEFCCQGHFIVNIVVKDILLWILLLRTFYCEFCCQGHFIYLSWKQH